MRYLLAIIACCATLLLGSIPSAFAQSHVALVIGNSAYLGGTLATTLADAGVVAETLRGAGYDVTELHDLRQADIGQAMRGFLDKAAAGGPDTVAFFYFAGQAAQAGGENYLIPIECTDHERARHPRPGPGTR